MPVILSEQPKKVPNLKPLNRPTLSKHSDFTNLKNPFKSYGPKTFGELMMKSRNSGGFKLPVPGEGLPRVIHYCADQSGCAFWRLLWPAEELLAHNKAVVMTLYQMVVLGQFYMGIDAVRLQRQCTEPQVAFIKFLRKVSDDMKQQTGKGFRIIYEVDDLVAPFSDLPQYNMCVDAFKDDKILHNVIEAVHLCVDKDTLIFCSVDGKTMDITVEELEEYFKEGRDIKVLSKNIDTGVCGFKHLDNCIITSENAEVVQITDDNGHELICTPDHPVYTLNRGWVEAGALETTDILDFV